MGAALGRRDDVDERLEPGVVARAPAERDVDGALARELRRDHGAAGGEDGHGLGERAGSLEPPRVRQRRVDREVVHELGDAPVEAEGLAHGLLAAEVLDVDAEPGHEEGGLARAAEELLGEEGRSAGEDLPVGPVADPRTGDALAHLAHDPQLAAGRERAERSVGARLPLVLEDARLAAPERHGVRLAAAIHLDVEALRQRVHDGSAHAVQSAR